MGKVKVKDQSLLELSDVQAMLSKAKTSFDQALVVFLWVFGSRISEVIQVKREDIYITNDKIFVKIPILKKRSKAVRPDHTLVVPIDTPFLEHLISYLDKLPPEGYIFPGRADGHIRRQECWRIITRLRDGMYPHFFRHNRLTRLAEQGCDGISLRSWAGWSDLRPASVYLSHRPVEAKAIT